MSFSSFLHYQRVLCEQDEIGIVSLVLDPVGPIYLWLDCYNVGSTHIHVLFPPIQQAVAEIQMQSLQF